MISSSYTANAAGLRTLSDDPGSGGGGTLTDSGFWEKVGSFILSLGGLLKNIHGTQHMDWDTANGHAITYATGVNANVKKLASSDTQFDAIGEQYRQNMIAFIQAVRTTRWGEGYPENTDNTLNALKTFPSGSDKAGKVFTTTWLWAMWTLRNTDLNNPDEWTKMAVFDMNHTLAPAISSVTGKVPPPVELKDVVTGSGVGTIGASGSSTTVAGLTLGSFGNEIFMVVVIGIVIWMVWKGHA